MSLVNSVTLPNNDHPFMIYSDTHGARVARATGSEDGAAAVALRRSAYGGASEPSSESATTPTISNSRRVTMASDWTTSAAARIIASRTLADSDESLTKAASSLWELIIVLGIH